MLFIIHLRSLHIDVLDPLCQKFFPESLTSMSRLAHIISLHHFAHNQHPPAVDSWSYSLVSNSIEYPRQIDGWNCGVHVCVASKCILFKNRFSFKSDSFSMTALRKVMYFELFKSCVILLKNRQR